MEVSLQIVIDFIECIGFLGLVLVFVSFIIKRWLWLYTFNMIGSAILTIYAYLRGNLIFTVLEAGLVFFLLRRFLEELKSKRKSH